MLRNSDSFHLSPDHFLSSIGMADSGGAKSIKDPEKQTSFVDSENGDVHVSQEHLDEEKGKQADFLQYDEARW